MDKRSSVFSLAGCAEEKKFDGIDPRSSTSKMAVADLDPRRKGFLVSLATFILSLNTMYACLSDRDRYIEK